MCREKKSLNKLKNVTLENTQLMQKKAVKLEQEIKTKTKKIRGKK